MSLKISPISINNRITSFSAVKEASGIQKPLCANPISEDETLRLQADECMKNGYFDKAVNLYKQALQINPDNTDANLNLAKTYRLNNDYKNAIPYFEKACAIESDDLELKTILGECYKYNGEYNKALNKFNEVLQLDPEYDYAKRNLLDTQNLLFSCYNPEQAHKERNDAAVKNLNTAVSMAVNFFPKDYVKKLQDITVTFDKTAKMGGRSNIAQYEHGKRKVSVMDEYTYANPVLTATYVAHEFVHGYDNDPYTSIREEQDAYRVQTKFWIKNAKNIKDPEMDYVVELYKQSPETLDKRVAEIYYLRDPNIPETSFNHPPGSRNTAAAKLGANSQPLKAYDVIV